jgi:hypothetical protein
MKSITDLENAVNTLSLSRHDIELKKTRELEKFRKWAVQKGIQDATPGDPRDHTPETLIAVCPCCGHQFIVPPTDGKGGAE